MKKYTRLSFLAIATVLMFTAGCKKANNIPMVTSVMVNPTAVDAGQTASVSVTATDLDNDPLIYSYQVNGGAIQAPGTGPAVQWISPSTEGAYSVTVTVTDGQGGSAMGTGALTVNKKSTVTKVMGTASFPAGTSGDLSNAKISIYSTYDNWVNNTPIKFGAVTGSGSSVSFTLDNVLPGNYYLDIWKDNDNSATWTLGDFVGWYGSGGLGSANLTEFQLTAGQTLNVTVNMLII